MFYIIVKGMVFSLFFLHTALYCRVLFAGEKNQSPIHFRIKFWTTENGLPQNTVNHIMQSQDGYLWLATNDGLVRFDGVKFTVFHTKKFPQLKLNRIPYVVESKDRSIWIATEGAGVVVKNKDGAIQTYSTANGLPHNNVFMLFEDRQGRMWITTQSGIIYVQNNRIYTFTTRDGLSDNRGYKVFEDSRHNLWIATFDGVLNRFHNGRASPIKTILGKPLESLHAIYEDKAHNLWIGGMNGFYRFQNETFTSVPLVCTHPVVSLAEDAAGGFWLVDWNNTIFRAKSGTTAFSPVPELNRFDRSRLMVDREGMLWIGTGSNGLLQFKTTPVYSLSTEKGLSLDIALSIHQDKQGVIRVGTNGGGLNVYENGRFKPFDPLPCKNAWTSLTDSNGDLWVGCYGGGFNRFRAGRLLPFKNGATFNFDVVLALYEDHQKNIWIGGNGLVVYKDEDFTDLFNKQGFAGSFVVSILQDSKGIMWFGTSDGGLNRYENGRFTNYSMANGLPNNVVRALLEDESGALWIGTYGGGLTRLKNGTFATIDTDRGLYDDIVSSIIDDGLGYYWMSCNRGIYRVSKLELNRCADGKIHEVACSYYNNEDGMCSPECNGGFQPSACKTGDGKIWFPTIRGVAVCDPGKAVINRKPPPVIIEKIVVDNRPLELNQKLVIAPGVGNFEFHYTGLSFVKPERMRFRFKMEGLDAHWKDVGARRAAYYSHIPSGHYTFRVKACNNDGIWNETGAAVSFYIKPYFYRTYWFYILGAMTVMLSLISYLKLRERRMKKNTEVLREMVVIRTHQLEEQAKKLADIDTLKSNFFTNISHEFRTPLTLIKGPLEQILAANPDKKLEASARMMMRNAMSLLDLIDQLLELAKLDFGKTKLKVSFHNIISFLEEIVTIFQLLASKKNITLTFHYDEAEILLYFDLEKMERIITNILSNAFNYTPDGGKIRVSAKRVQLCDYPGGCVEIKIRDTGQGIPADQLPHIFDRFFRGKRDFEFQRKGTGIGMALTKDLVELHHGTVEAWSSCADDETRGTEITLYLPLGKTHLQTGDFCGEPIGVRATHAIEAIAFTDEAEEMETNGSIDVEPKDKKNIILVIEDNRDMRTYIRGILEPDYRVVESVNGTEGIRNALEIIPDLVISDIMMPQKDGYEVCVELKKNIATSHIPIILLTARAAEKNIIQGLETGADDYITKPFHAGILRARVRNLMDSRHRLQDYFKREMELKPVKIEVSSVEQRFIAELKGIVEANHTDPEFNVEGLAKKLDMSGATLYRKVMALTGDSPTDYLRSYRLNRAVQLLEGNFGNITQIAFTVGFSSAAYFSKCFKEKFQCTPSEYLANK